MNNILLFDKIKKSLGFLRDFFMMCYLFFTTKNYFFFPTYQTGGAERVHLDIVKAMKKKNIVFFFNESLNNHYYKEFSKNSHIIEMYKYKNNKYFMLMFTKFIQLLRYKTFFGSCNYDYYNILPFIHPSNQRIDLIHNITFPLKWVDFYSLDFINFLDKRVIIYSGIKNFYEEKYSLRNINSSFLKRFTTIYNGVQIPEVLHKNYFEEKINIIFCGRIETNKRVNLLVEAIERVNSEKINFKIYGPKIYEDPKIDKYYVKNIESEDELKEVYQETHILLLASIIEGTPNVIMEGMSNGVVCISTNVGGVSEILVDNENGFLISDGKEEMIINQFENAIKNLESDRNKLKKMSLSAYNYASENFDIHIFNEKYRNLLEN